MVCRQAQIGSAVTSYVLQATSLEEQQVLSLYHEVMREGRTAGAPTPRQSTLAINRLARQVEAASGLTDARRRSIMARIDRARNEEMNGSRFYATDRLVERAQRAEEAIGRFVGDSARRLGVSEDEVRSRLASLRTEAEGDTSLRVDRSVLEGLRNDARWGGLPLDRQTAYAVERINAECDAVRAAQPTRTAVTRHPQPQSSSIEELGYDDATGRVEVVMRSNPGVVYAYRMTREEWNEFAGARSIGSYYSRNVRGNDRFRYATSDDATAAATQVQCPTCGQFADDSHACPTRDSVEERNRTERLARQSARRTASGSTAPTRTRGRATPLTNADEEAQREDDAARTAPAAPDDEPTRLSGPERTYHGDSGCFRTIPLGNVQHASRMYGRVNIPVGATINTIAGEGGSEERVRRGTVTGNMTVTYNGRGRGYTAEAITSPGDSGRDQLRCNCPDYQRNYDCVHIRQAVQDLNNRINQSALRDRHGLGEAISIVNAELAQDRAESVEAQAASRANDTVSSVSYVEDNAAFQRDYKAAKDRQAAGEPPVPYMTENATGGLGARGTGRAFGVELEFDFGPGVDRSRALRNIGRRLHAAGLTRYPGQRGYHSAEYAGYTENHQGGWSFEADMTVAGEIVSPIMYDEPETWQNLDLVCTILREEGAVVSLRTGSHVHVSAGNYDHTVENHNRLLGTFAENEDTIYRLSANPERGTHRGSQWCAPNRVPSSGYSSLHQARAGNNSHHVGLNLQSMAGDSSDHVEFRTYDASLDPAVIQTQIKMSLAVTEAAFRDTAYQPGSHTPLGSHRAHNRQTHGASRRLTGEAWRQDTAGYRAFADHIFRRPEDKAQMTALFAITRWQRGTR